MMNLVNFFKRNLSRLLIIAFGLFYALTSTSANAAGYGCPTVSYLTGNQTVDLSSAFTLSTTKQITVNTNWSGSVSCPLANVVMWYRQPYTTPVYLHYTDSTTASGYWIKLTITATPKQVSLKNTGATTFNASSYPATLTITAELVDAPVGTVDTLTSATGSITTAVSLATSNSDVTESDARTAALTNQFGFAIWMYLQKITFTFKPQATTCSAADKNVSLNKVSLSDLRSGTTDGSSAFTLDLSCNSGLFNTTTNPVKVWLSSNDIVDGESKVIRNSGSTAPGIGVALQTSDQQPVVFAGKSGVEGTTLLSMKKGDKFANYNFNIPLTAHYRIYDSKTAGAGSVSATATVMFSWE